MPWQCTFDDKYRNQHHLRRIKVSEAVAKLDFYLAMDGNLVKHEEVLQEKADKFAGQIAKSNCDPNTAIYAYNKYSTTSLEYNLVLSDFIEK